MTISKNRVKAALEKIRKIEEATGKNLDKEKSILENLLRRPVKMNESFVGGPDDEDEQIIVSNDSEQDYYDKKIEEIDKMFELYK